MQKVKDRLRDHLKNSLTPFRYNHSLGVERASTILARKFDLPVERCALAGLGHDICREMSSADLERLTGLKNDNPILLHGEAGAAILRDQFHISDNEVLNAVRYHISGHKKLDNIGKVVFAADYLEEGRSHLDDRERERLFSLHLDDMVLDIALSIRNYLTGRGVIVDSCLNDMIEVLS